MQTNCHQYANAITKEQEGFFHRYRTSAMVSEYKAELFFFFFLWEPPGRKKYLPIVCGFLFSFQVIPLGIFPMA